MDLEFLPYLVLLMACLLEITWSPNRDWHEATATWGVLVAAWSASNIAWLAAWLDGLPVVDGVVILWCLLNGFHRRGGWRLLFCNFSWATLALDVPMTLWGGKSDTVYSLVAALMAIVFAGQIYSIASSGDRDDCRIRRRAASGAHGQD